MRRYYFQHALIIVVTIAAMTLVGCAGQGGSSVESSGVSSAVQESSEVAAEVGEDTADASASSSEAVEEEVQPAEPEFIYPWVVASRHEEGRDYEYAYNDAGQLVAITGLQEEHLSWDTQIAEGIETVEITYDEAGRISHIKPGTPLAGDIDVFYDGDGRVATVVHEWFAPGRFPEAGTHTETATYAYDDAGNLASGTFEDVVEDFETTTTFTERTYGHATDEGYDGAVMSDAEPRLVLYSATNVMAGQQAATGATGELDENGNLVRAEIPGADTVTYTYQQIAVPKDSWQPNALSNPTLLTFLYDGLSASNYTLVFPPQLTEADVARVLSAPGIDVEPQDAADDGGEAAAAAGAAQETITTPYYTITIPEEWADNYDYLIESEDLATDPSGYGIGYHATVWLGAEVGSMEGQRFEVACFTDNWGVQGQYATYNLGSIPSAPGWHAVIYSPEGQANSVNPQDFAHLVELK